MRIIQSLHPTRSGSFAKYQLKYDGNKDSEAVEAFISAITVYKRIENISDEDAITGIPLLLRDQAAIWWQGVKDTITTWEDFATRLRHAFAPKVPAYLLYKTTIGEQQDSSTNTETFIAKKRALIAQLPKPAPNETHQLDMVFGQLHIRIREKVARNSVKSFDELLEAARSAEELLDDPTQPREDPREQQPSPSKLKPTTSCEYCRNMGYTIEDCGKKKRNEAANSIKDENGSSASTSRFSCYGCGTPA